MKAHHKRKRRAGFWLLPVLLLLAACGGTAAQTPTSQPAPTTQPTTAPTAVPAAMPIPAAFSGDFRVHDPSMIREGDAYYVFSTGDERGLNNGNIQVRRSTDLTKWEIVATVFETIPTWVSDELGGTLPNLWAPDVSFFNGKYYVYYAGSRFGSNTSVIGLATNITLDPSKPGYKWVDEGMVIRSERTDNWNAIDPNLAFDADGTPWLAFGSYWDGIKMRKIDRATGKLDDGDKTLYSLASRGGGPVEAPSIIRHGDFYYLFVSFDACCRGEQSTYNIRVGRSGAITGPYADRDGKPMMQGGGTLFKEGDNERRGPGGQTAFLDGDTYRLVYHYYDVADRGLPKLQIADLVWGDDGWPSLK